jgi:glycosyltransferase involved in cell wall biosynthesis
MKILLANWQDRRNPEAGGAEVHLFELFSRMVARGHQVDLVCSGYAGAAAVAEVDGITVHRFGGRHSFAVRSSAAIRTVLRRVSPQVVVDDINKLPLCTPMLTPVPVYAIVPHLFGSTAFEELPWPLASMVWAAERVIPTVYRHAWFHAISDSTRDDLVARGVPRARIAVVYPGVDVQHFSADSATPRAVPPRFVYIGRLKRYKGVEYLIRALAVVRRTRPEVSLDIAGSGDDRPRLEQLARQLDQGSAIRFRGFVDDATRLRLLREAVANVFPSPKEGWGITVMEAAACGTPSIASDAPGLRDSVRNGETGVLVPHGDVDRLALAMTAMAGHRDVVERMGVAARSWAERLSWDAATDVVEQHLIDLAHHRLNADTLVDQGV